MDETMETTETTETVEGSWLDAHEHLGDENKQLFAKYKTEADFHNGAANAIRMIGKSVRFPDEKTSEEDRAAFDAKVNKYRGVPENGEYELDRSIVPENIEYDEELETSLKQWAKDHHASAKDVSDLHEMYCKSMLGRHEVMEKAAKEGEDALRKEWGEDFDKKIGKEGDKNVGTIKAGLIQLSKMLKMDYKDGEGNPQSHLIDDLEFIRPGGAIGDKTNLTKAIDYLIDYRFAEGRTHQGEPVGHGVKVSGEALSDDFYANPEPGGEE